MKYRTYLNIGTGITLQKMEIIYTSRGITKISRNWTLKTNFSLVGMKSIKKSWIKIITACLIRDIIKLTHLLKLVQWFYWSEEEASHNLSQDKHSGPMSHQLAEILQLLRDLHHTLLKYCWNTQTSNVKRVTIHCK